MNCVDDTFFLTQWLPIHLRVDVNSSLNVTKCNKKTRRCKDSHSSVKYLGEDDEIENFPCICGMFLVVYYHHRQSSETRSMQKGNEVKSNWTFWFGFSNVNKPIENPYYNSTIKFWIAAWDKNGTLSVWFNRVLGDALWWRWSWWRWYTKSIFFLLFQSEMVYSSFFKIYYMSKLKNVARCKMYLFRRSKCGFGPWIDFKSMFKHWTENAVN